MQEERLRVMHGERLGRLGRLRIGCSALIFDEAREKVLLTRREDNGQWCLPGGGMEPGESVAENCAREVREETGLQVRLTRLLGVYSDPDRLVEYADGNRFQMVVLSFEAQVVGGELGLSDETTAYGWFTPEEALALDLLDQHAERIRDALASQAEAFIR